MRPDGVKCIGFSSGGVKCIGRKKNIEEINKKLSEIGIKTDNRKKIDDFDLKCLKIAMLSPIDSEAIYDFKSSLTNKLKYGEKDHYYPEVKTFEFKYDKKSFENGFNVSQLNLAIDTGFNCIVIARGGGSFQQLNLINNYLLAEAIAKSPVPIYLAVGHARDLHALDSIVTECFFTPSSCAHYFLEKFKSDSYSRYKKSKADEEIKDYKSSTKITAKKPKKPFLIPFLVLGVAGYLLYRIYVN
jgi:exonuclease VII large subunit